MSPRVSEKTGWPLRHNGRHLRSECVTYTWCTSHTARESFQFRFSSWLWFGFAYDIWLVSDGFLLSLRRVFNNSVRSRNLFQTTTLARDATWRTHRTQYTHRWWYMMTYLGDVIMSGACVLLSRLEMTFLWCVCWVVRSVRIRQLQIGRQMTHTSKETRRTIQEKRWYRGEKS